MPYQLHEAGRHHTDIHAHQAVDPDALAQLRILVAEDGPDNQRLISHYLRLAGATVHLVANGREACRQALDAQQRGEPFDLILMDIQMPEMDGYEATRTLRQAGYHRPIIALTAHAAPTDRDRCFAAGCDDYETKPINHSRLIDLINHWTRGRNNAA